MINQEDAQLSKCHDSQVDFHERGGEGPTSHESKVQTRYVAGVEWDMMANCLQREAKTDASGYPSPEGGEGGEQYRM